MKNGKEFLLTDTVGFIQKLPTTLVDNAKDPEKIKSKAKKRADVICISGLTIEGLDDFCKAVQKNLKDMMV
ncbi:hypothetical protein Sango_2356500 [Sesamum angolense]|uniref:Uncharacterized protein n=1 Tax=Sesamum angolense TaxID=2727404 RepID=A0AAE2BJE1_9LAMI|nr:hypothetical protein Sango_2356500 [Sesamum angolense]